MFIPNPSPKITNQTISKLLVYFTLEEAKDIVLREKNKIYKEKLKQFIKNTESN